MTRRAVLTEQRGYHGYADNGRPIPKRRTAVQQTQTPDTTHYGDDEGKLEEVDTEEEYDTTWPPRMPTSARRYVPEGTYTQGGARFHVKYASPPTRPAPQQRSPATPKSQPVTTEDVVTKKNGGFHWLLFMGVGMLLMLILWVLGNAALTWWNTAQDDIHYGIPRTFQCDAVVGHSDSASNPSHFIALNLHKRVLIIEFPGGDPTHAKVYVGPVLIGDGQELTPVTVSFKDVTGNGKPDMLLHIQSQTVVFINENGTFRPALPTDHIHL